MSTPKQAPPKKKQTHLTFEQTLAILAQVPKTEVDEMEAKRQKRAEPKRKRPKG